MPLTPDNCGITARHIGVIQNIARERQSFIFARLVNRDSTTLIDEGYRTKKLDIHAKSSNWGPMAGFICVDSTLSKVVSEGAEKIRRNEQAVREGLHHAGVGQVQLAISLNRADELARKGRIPGGWAPGVPFALPIPGQGGRSLRFRIGEDGSRAEPLRKRPVYVGQRDDALAPLMVLGYRQGEEVIAVTADYDLFAICPHHSAPGFQLGRVVQVHEQGALGTLSTFQRTIKDLINQRCGPPDVVNHGTELNNPFPENEAQIAMFPPGGNHRLVPRGKLHQIFGDMTIRGFHVYVNDLWGVAFKTHIGAKMSRLRNPALRATLRLEYLDPGDFAGMNLDGYGNEVGTAATMQRFGVEVANNRASTVRPPWRR
jgi:hypothetical protein